MLPLTCPESESSRGVKGRQGPHSTVHDNGRSEMQLDLRDYLLERRALIVVSVKWTVSLL
jgi:hypothetical protein